MVELTRPVRKLNNSPSNMGNVDSAVSTEETEVVSVADCPAVFLLALGGALGSTDGDKVAENRFTTLLSSLVANVFGYASKLGSFLSVL